MTKTIQNHIIKHWKKVLEEYELVKRRQNPHFKTVKALCEFYDISPKQLHKYNDRFLSAGGDVKSLLPKKRGPNTWGKRMYLLRISVTILVSLPYVKYYSK